MSNKLPNEDSVLVAGKLADIELPQAPVTDLSWVIPLLGWTLFFTILVVLLVAYLANSRTRQAQLKQSFFVWSIIARYKLWQINRFKQSCLPKALGASDALLHEEILSNQHAIQKSVFVLFTMTKDMQALLEMASERLKKIENTSKHTNKSTASCLRASLNQYVLKNNAIHAQLESILFSAPEVSRETNIIEFCQALESMNALVSSLPYWRLFKTFYWRQFAVLMGKKERGV